MDSNASTSSDEKEARLVSDSPEALSEAREIETHEGNANGTANDNTHLDHFIEVDDSEDSEDDIVDEEEGEEDEEDEDDDEEPALKYERLGGSVHDLLQKDSASALAHSKQRLVRSHEIFHVYSHCGLGFRDT